MTDQQFQALHAQLVKIHEALLERGVPRPTSPSSSSSSSEDIPLPVEPVANAASVEVHFGKNKGVPLGRLSRKSIEWYAKEQPKKLMHDGNPFPDRPQDVTLREAARTLYHLPQVSLTPQPSIEAQLEQDPF